MDLYINYYKGYGEWIYQVWVDGSLYDQFSTPNWLTNAEVDDVRRGYLEGLTGYPAM